MLFLQTGQTCLRDSTVCPQMLQRQQWPQGITAQVTNAVMHFTHLTFKGDKFSTLDKLACLSIGEDDWTAPIAEPELLGSFGSLLQARLPGAGVKFCSHDTWFWKMFIFENGLLTESLGGFEDISMNSGGDSSSIGRCTLGGLLIVWGGCWMAGGDV